MYALNTQADKAYEILVNKIILNELQVQMNTLTINFLVLRKLTSSTYVYVYRQQGTEMKQSEPVP